MATRRNNPDNGRARDEFFARVDAEGAYAPVFLLTGEERYLVDDALRRVVRSVFPSGRDDFNLETWRGGLAKGIDVSSACRTLPMFAARRVCVLRDVDEVSAAELGPIAEYVTNPEPSTVLVLEGVKLSQQSKAGKAIAASPSVVAVEFGSLSPQEAVRWVAGAQGRHGVRLDGAGAEYLVEALGPSLFGLDKALERIALYIGTPGSSATLDQVREVVPDLRSRTVFDLVDAVASRDTAGAVSLARRLVEQGESGVGTVAMIAMHFRRVLRVHAALREGVSSRDLSSALGLPGFLVGRYEQQARRFSDRDLRQALRGALQADRSLKSSRLPDDLLVDRLVMSICAPGR